MSGRIGVVFGKEVRENLRDRRSLVSTVLYALLGPAMLLLMLVALGSLFREEAEKPLELPVAGQENAPSLMQFLAQNNVILLPAPPDPHQAVRSGDVPVVLVVPDSYPEAFRAGRSAPVELVVDTSRASAAPTIERARELLRGYGSQVGALRLLARGVSPEAVRALEIEQADVSTPRSRAFIFMNMLPYFLVVTVFLGSAAVIIDATAGERERGSLEPLLINPVPRDEFVIGKLLAALPFSVIAVLISLAAFGLGFNVVPVERFIGVRLTVDVSALGVIFLVCLPMTILAAGLQMIIATFAGTVKEAQTYVNWLPLVPALPGVVLAFLPVKATVWNMLIPTFGQQLLINQLVRGERVSMVHVGISAASTLFLAGVLVLVAMRLYRREQILFGKR